MILETDPKLQASLDSLSSLYVPTSTSNSAVPGQVPLSVVARVREGTAPLRIDHLGQFPSTAISFNLGPGGSLGEAVEAIKQARQEIGMPISEKSGSMPTSNEAACGVTCRASIRNFCPNVSNGKMQL